MLVEKNVPMPEQSLKINGCYPWKEMTDVGDSFLAGPIESMQKIYSSCRKHNQRYPDTRFICDCDPGGKGVRVWRVK